MEERAQSSMQQFVPQELAEKDGFAP
jgi:hypothetical protein